MRSKISLVDGHWGLTKRLRIENSAVRPLLDISYTAQNSSTSGKPIVVVFQS